MVLEDELRAAGIRADLADVAAALREAGVHVTQHSRSRWVADPQHQAVRRWKRDLAEAAGDGD